MIERERKALRKLASLLGLPRALLRPGAGEKPDRAALLAALFADPARLAGFPLVQAALVGAAHPEAMKGAVEGMPPLLPEADFAEALALMAHAAELPRQLDVIEMLTRDGLRRVARDRLDHKDRRDHKVE